MDVIYYGVGAEPAGAFDNANRGAERYAAARSDTTMNQPQHTGGSAIASPPATILNRYAIPCTAFSACANITSVSPVLLSFISYYANSLQRMQEW